MTGSAIQQGRLETASVAESAGCRWGCHAAHPVQRVGRKPLARDTPLGERPGLGQEVGVRVDCVDRPVAVASVAIAATAILLSTAAAWALVRFVFEGSFALPGPSLLARLIKLVKGLFTSSDK